MAHRDSNPVHVPLRTSSRNLLRPGAMEDQKNSAFVERKSSKAQRILGTDLPLPNGQNGWDSLQPTQQKKPKSRRQSLRTPDSTSRSRKQNTSFAAFPKSEDTIQVPPQNLRVRASSPLLGQEYRSQDPAPPLPKPSKKIHPSSSSSTLFSYFSSKEKDSSKSKSSPTTPKGLQPRVRNEWQAEPQVTFQQPQPPKESKRKLRPPRIDLSVLFPKPRKPTTNPHLLSPQRMTSSPSPVSTVVSDWPSNKADQAGSNSTAKRFGDALPARSSVFQNEAPKPTADRSDRSDLLSIPESKNYEWYEPPLERTVGTSEIDLALDRYAGRRSLLSRSSVYTASREQLQADQRNTDSGANARRTRSPSGNRRKDSYLAPAPQPETNRPRKVSSAAESNSRSVKSNMTKKSSKSTLKNKDLQNSSVLCLSSSSEDETEEDVETPTDLRPNQRKSNRDSVATYDESDAEIYTASTAHMYKRAERTKSTGSRGSHPNTQKQQNKQQAQQVQQVEQPKQRRSSRRDTTASANSKSTTKTTQSRRSIGAPALPQQDILDQFPQQRLRPPHELKEMNRRSRVIAVTRQEQDLLEAMRLRKGKVTPSLFQYSGAPPVPEVDRSSMISGPSRDSFVGSDTSFLRLSAAFPPFQARTDQGATQMDGSPSQSSSSDTEQKIGNSVASSRFSTAYSESLPSPATSGASPLTPTLPIHRFSPLPSPKPAPRGPPPAIPQDQKRHSRRRTDSSEAIMLDNGDPQNKHDLPLWSFDFDWNTHDQSNVAAVH
ncbi:hypothetical protein N7533_009077 [Penicillium manginii]|uniref:uncharacterized protein n=1 Tax=Penicillium manginii TaxID=203109 RepID=UPI002547D9B2|nr:uncharacterized protein N7533_009077 [Penicillium manginii]KAJ5744207.1 hypothetical protein N7533_009077 [Penicillium manginii]